MKVAIAGAGAVGRSVARELIENEHDVTLIERKSEHIDVDAIPAAHWQVGDACEVSVLELVKLHEFDVVADPRQSVSHRGAHPAAPHHNHSH